MRDTAWRFRDFADSEAVRMSAVARTGDGRG